MKKSKKLKKFHIKTKSFKKDIENPQKQNKQKKDCLKKGQSYFILNKMYNQI